MHHELRLDHACHRLRLPAGTLLHCHQGPLWLTSELRGACGASPDTVLQSGDCHRIAAPGDYFLSDLGPQPGRCGIEPPRHRGRRRWALSLA